MRGKSYIVMAGKIVVCLAVCAPLACGSLSQSNESVIAIQNNPIKLECSGQEEKVLYLNLHANESTSVEAARRLQDEIGGTICRLNHDGGRNISFDFEDARYAFDPNRMFTDTGAALSLRSLSSTDSIEVPDEVVESVRRFAEQILSEVSFQDRPIVVALHNNTESQYSARSYLPGAAYEQDAEAVHLEPDADPDDFFFVTERRLFDALAAEGFNVVLQQNASVTDDGSLSVYAARQGVRYVNVEAQHGHRAEQTRMIRALDRVLGSADRP